MQTILITGGSGLIGRHLTPMLQHAGYEVAWLSRNASHRPGHTRQYGWDWRNKKIDAEALEKADILIHLSGANVSGKRWTESWKKEIYESRVNATDFLHEAITTYPNKISAFISGSATGYYGATTSDKIYDETDKPGSDFLARTCQMWEGSALRLGADGLRVAIVRTGIVLAKEGGAMKKLVTPVNLGIGSAIGSGRQNFPWIHIDDICGLFMKAVTDQNMTGIYNGVAPEFRTNDEVMKTLASVMNKPYFFPNVPSFVIKILFGEMSGTLLNGSRISVDKIIREGYRFKYPVLKDALVNLTA